MPNDSGCGLSSNEDGTSTIECENGSATWTNGSIFGVGNRCITSFDNDRSEKYIECDDGTFVTLGPGKYVTGDPISEHSFKETLGAILPNNAIVEGYISATNKVDLAIFSEITKVVGSIDIRAVDLDVISFPNLQQVWGYLSVASKAPNDGVAVRTFSSSVTYIAGDLFFENNWRIDNIALSLEKVEGAVRFIRNDALSTINISIKTIGDYLVINNNPTLANLSLYNLKTVVNRLEITENKALCGSIATRFVKEVEVGGDQFVFDNKENC